MDSIIDRRANNTYQLDPDAYRGFTTAVRNGQVRLALEYLVPYLHAQAERISQLESDLAAAQAEPETPRRGRRPRAETDDSNTSTVSSPPTPPKPAPGEVPVKENEIKETPDKEKIAS